MDVLREGFFGTTLLDADRACAVKWLGIRDVHKKELQQRIQTLTALGDTEHLVRYKDVGATKGECWVSTEFCAQLSLEVFRGRLVEPALAQVMIFVIEALDVLHGQQVFHGDLHPSNIFIQEENGVKLSDYGVFDLLQRYCEEAHILRHPPWWSAPERFSLREHSPVTPSEDVWGLATLLIDLAEGGPRFSETHPDIVKRQLSDGSSTLALQTPEKWSMFMSDFISACAVLRPENRPSLSELREHRFLQLASPEVLDELIKAIRLETLTVPQNTYKLDPNDELERIYRMNVTFQMPYLSADIFPPEAFQKAEADESDENSGNKFMLPGLKAALAYYRKQPFLSSERIYESKLRVADLEVILKNIERR
eukprot:Plantae.Rhodophyta-Purpureofilum_apyrenoidigerum.ctg18050.p1 GENE.Plantae.Rhodophyta-Purpureofilum_apyrenoidigerum.ctg18050~~Plantae.Rhodophyta-Purpureofilum_apyrenoidigerum.ctg18050.p1  ORF type:complete len:367 (-),score=60.70 Plantae.Rhodophyta-Purpureofilum_apyrenoidigerum.ctg18050:493-1593(-)